MKKPSLDQTLKGNVSQIIVEVVILNGGLWMVKLVMTSLKTLRGSVTRRSTGVSAVMPVRKLGTRQEQVKIILP